MHVGVHDKGDGETDYGNTVAPIHELRVMRHHDVGLCTQRGIILKAAPQTELPQLLVQLVGVFSH